MNNPIVGYVKPKKKDKKKNDKKRRGITDWSSWYSSRYSNKQKHLEQNPSVRSNNIKLIDKPLSNFDLINWVNKLKIKHFIGVFSRDNLPNQINEPEVGIINLDTKIGPGTHWVCYRNVDEHICKYYDSFGLIMPTEIQKYLQTSSESHIYNEIILRETKKKQTECVEPPGYVLLHLCRMRY